MSTRLTYCVSEELWVEAFRKLEERILKLSTLLKCGTTVKYGDGVQSAPCTSELWRTYIRTEHDEYTCYFRHWFRKIDDKPVLCRFSHTALMPLVRSCVWQTLLAEFITGKLAGRDAVRRRVEEELEHYSNLKSSEVRRQCGMLAQDFFGLIKNHLNSSEKPLNRAGLGSAEKMVIDLPGMSYKSSRRGWSNRTLRKTIVQRIIDAGIGELPNRKEQEAFIWKWVSVYGELKQTAPKAILKALSSYYDSETGEVLMKPWSKEELSEIRREARNRGVAAKLLERATEISEKMSKGEKLTPVEKVFKSKHKNLFEPVNSSGTQQNQGSSEVSEQNAICNRKQDIQKEFCSETHQQKAEDSKRSIYPLSKSSSETGLIRNPRSRK